MALKDIKGHTKIINILRGYIRKERLPHALLFAGDEGIGKRLTAINLAKVLNCNALRVMSNGLKKDTNHALRITHYDIDCCDECPSCKKIDKLMHPDVFLIRPEGSGGQIKVEPIRELQESLSYKPYEGRWKVAIIDDADALNISAANAFLSTLEEPPDEAIIILITSRPDMLLETILSRCQRLNFFPLPLGSMGQLLRDKYKGIDNTQLTLLSELSGGRLGHAMNEDLIKQRDRSLDIFLKIQGNPSKDLWKDKKEMEEWFDWCELWLRDIAVFKATGNPDLLINKDRLVEIKKFGDEMELGGILKLSRELYNIKRLLHFNLNRPVTLYYINLLYRQMRRRGI
jgi:DNA polymerase-3 subunit delta'